MQPKELLDHATIAKKESKGPKRYIGKNQLKELLDKPNLSIEDIAKKLGAEIHTVRHYISKYEF